jgi:hypothetical protein
MPLMRAGPGLVRGVARTAVVAGTATAVSGRVARRQQSRWAEQQQGAYQEEAPPAQAAAPAAAPDYTAELEKLAKLRDEGVISAEDFDAKKKQLLGI